jgi:hypothetical protein
MPNTPVVNSDVMTITAIGSLYGQTTLSVFHYVIADAPPGSVIGSPDYLQLGDQWKTAFWTGAWRIIASFEFNLIALRIQKVYPTRYLPYLYIVEEQGENLEEATPSGCALIVRRQAELAEKSHRGRVYFPGVARSLTSEGRWTIPSGDPSISTMMAGMLADLSTIELIRLKPIIWSESSAGNTSRLVVGSAYDNIVRYQRRREVGVGI